MKTGRIRKEIIGIYRHQPEGVDQIIDDIIDRELKKRAIGFAMAAFLENKFLNESAIYPAIEKFYTEFIKQKEDENKN